METRVSQPLSLQASDLHFPRARRAEERDLAADSDYKKEIFCCALWGLTQAVPTEYKPQTGRKSGVMVPALCCLKERGIAVCLKGQVRR